MAFSFYHEKFRQIGTDVNSYQSWVNSNALLTGLRRLKCIMNKISLPSSSMADDEDTIPFERELDYKFHEDDQIMEKNNGRTVVGVNGICDWVNEESLSSSTRSTIIKHHYEVDLLEIKFVHELSNIHRLQVLVYSALVALNMDACNHNDGDSREIKESDYVELSSPTCRGMLYNARTGETEMCSMKVKDAKRFLLDISQFKYNGIEHHQKRQIEHHQKRQICNDDWWDLTPTTQCTMSHECEFDDDIYNMIENHSFSSSPRATPKKRLRHSACDEALRSFDV